MDEFLEYEVRDVMSKPVTVGPSTSVADAQELLDKTGFNGISVVWDGGTLVGFVTSLDVLKAFCSGGESAMPDYGDVMRRPVYSIMQQNPATVNPRMPLVRLLQKMVVSRNKSFPVIDPRNGHGLVGIVTREDVMRGMRLAYSGMRPEAKDTECECA